MFMTWINYIPLINSLFCVFLGFFVLAQKPRNLINRVFCLGMATLSLVEFGHFQILTSFGGKEIIFWAKFSFLLEIANVPIWLVFSLVFARSDFQKILPKWKFPLILGGLLSGIFMILTVAGDFIGNLLVTQKQIVGFQLTPWSYSFYIFQLFLLVIILINLENTFRASFGPKRWQIKYFLLSLGALFAFWIYLGSQYLLFSIVDTKLFIIQSMVLTLLLGFITFTLVWRRILDVDVFVSRYVIYNSLTLFLVGGYLILVGVIAQGIYNQNENWSVFLGTFFFFLAVLSLTIILLSEKLRIKERV